MVDYIREESWSDNVIAGNPGSLAGRPVTSTGPGRPVFEPKLHRILVRDRGELRENLCVTVLVLEHLNL